MEKTIISIEKVAKALGMDGFGDKEITAIIEAIDKDNEIETIE